MNDISNVQIRAMMQDVAQNAANISILMNNLEEQRSDTKKILSYLENDPTTGRMGLFSTQLEHGRRLEIIEDARDAERTKQKIYLSIATFVGGLVMSLGTFLFKAIFGR